tara:strand:+ start:5937 stop:6806 length:870 start_codon:yes stop_codon:yes gene_type:complete
MKGIILAAGKGTRLHPLTKIVSKQLLPVYDKPMIYYPLSTLMLLGITEVLIITTPEDKSMFTNLLGDGSRIGMKINYEVQREPNGIAEAFIVGEDFIDNSSVTLILGDNLFYGHGYLDFLRNKMEVIDGATIFGYWVKKPQAYGVVEFDQSNKVISIEEKPLNPKSNYAVPGLYIYDDKVVQFAKQLSPSKRGELEITDLNNLYLDQGLLHVELLSRGVAWLDTGTQKSLIEAGKFIETIESRQGLKVGCIEEVAYQLELIDKSQLQQVIGDMPDNDYKQYLSDLIQCK